MKQKPAQLMKHLQHIKHCAITVTKLRQKAHSGLRSDFLAYVDGLTQLLETVNIETQHIQP
jgi:hypothetical protein